MTKSTESVMINFRFSIFDFRFSISPFTYAPGLDVQLQLLQSKTANRKSLGFWFLPSHPEYPSCVVPQDDPLQRVRNTRVQHPPELEGELVQGMIRVRKLGSRSVFVGPSIQLTSKGFITRYALRSFRSSARARHSHRSRAPSGGPMTRNASPLQTPYAICHMPYAPIRSATNLRDGSPSS